MTKLIKVVNRDQCISCFSCAFACAVFWQHAITPDKADIVVRRYPGVEGAFSIRACYGCLDPDCARACPTQALTPREGEEGLYSKVPSVYIVKTNHA
jgi:Fe-S-cluster-containing dehydrogenase component